MGEVTQLLDEARRGDKAALERFYTRVYGELEIVAQVASAAPGANDPDRSLIPGQRGLSADLPAGSAARRRSCRVLRVRVVRDAQRHRGLPACAGQRAARRRPGQGHVEHLGRRPRLRPMRFRFAQLRARLPAAHRRARAPRRRDALLRRHGDRRDRALPGDLAGDGQARLDQGAIVSQASTG